MDYIRLLPDSVANQIAAGEVIQRPASIIKELVENAVDAGAKRISIYVKDAGRTLVQVIDDGRGMSETDARMAFERHATSKISSAEDLSTLRTMGFRGEALPSICAVAQVEVRTRPEECRLGTVLEINGSKVVRQEQDVCEKGTSIAVKNLFYNTPGRRKFLKSDNVELSNILREFERMAIVNPDCHLSIDTGARIIDLRPATFKERILDLWKNTISRELLPISTETNMAKIEGYICKPEHARKRGYQQFLIVNGRNMKHPRFHRVIMNCYSKLIQNETQPSYFIKFEVDPSTIDVNVHPTKNEIKFEAEQDIAELLGGAVKGVLGSFEVPSIDFEHKPIEVVPPTSGDHIVNPARPDMSGYNPFSSGPSMRRPAASRQTPKDWDKLYSDFISDTPPQPTVEMIQPAIHHLAPENIPVTELCLQYDEKYIVTQSRSGLLIIDQYRAHVRIIYEDLMKNAFSGKDSGAQLLIFPEIIELDERQLLRLESMQPELERLGIQLKPLEDNRWQIASMPSLLQDTPPVQIVTELLSDAGSEIELFNPAADEADFLRRRAAVLMARSGALRKGRVLTSAEMESIVARLFALPNPQYTPDGLPIYVSLNPTKISSLFSK